ncbi:hypothetical protein [Arenibaculum pallidiluteum]|uniref:hypothetical protein n=1 Tax=Arenibaculum pallidiluteum TaxID=2812559 RepID=UPI001A95EFA2|nr:hypothetical protein [Arenibaculum pallidiluteum]
MSIRCRCLLAREGRQPVWSDKDLRLPPRAGDSVQFDDGGEVASFRIDEVMHTPALDGVDFALILTELPGTRGKPFREIFEEAARTGPTR